uniref:Tetraspanin n=1 Tax=Branchiostoma floridae TaxID=7739 RepID=C3YHT3_BRAFL|eukprot:XP_002604059.1 hypothetical protein BRAFLDRAFT_71651 [Branchiostoma floridae]
MARYHARCVHGLGLALVVLGVLSVAFGIATTAVLSRAWYPDPASYISAPVWSGLAVVATGILAVLSGKRPENRCLMIGLLVVAIVTTMLTLFCCLLTIVEAHLAGRCVTAAFPSYTITGFKINHTTGGHNYTIIDESPPTCSAAPLPLRTVCAVLSFTEAALGLAVSVMCCYGLAGQAVQQPVVYIPGAVTEREGGHVIVQTVGPPDLAR